MPQLHTFISYPTQAEEAAKFYVSIFPKSKILSVSHYGGVGPMPAGTVMTVDFLLMGQRYTALNGGDHFEFTDAFSINVTCKDQKEIDLYSKKLSAKGGFLGPCGWIRDRFGMWWQVNTPELIEMVCDKDQAAAARAMAAMMKMTKFDIARMRKAWAGEKPAKKKPAKAPAKSRASKR